MSVDVSVWTEAVEALGFEPLTRVENGPVIRVTDDMDGLVIAAVEPYYGRGPRAPKLPDETVTGTTLREVFEKLLGKLSDEEIAKQIDRTSLQIERLHQRMKDQGDVSFVLLAEGRRRYRAKLSEAGGRVDA